MARPSAVYGCWLAVRLGLSAHQVTVLSLVSSLGAAAAIAMGTRGGFVAGVAFSLLAFWLDHVDGQVARWRRTASLDGVYFDYLMHHVANLALGFALGYGLAARTGNIAWTIAGFAIALGWSLLSLHNDCRYKAFFQRLKSTSASYRVDGDGGGGGRPQPPARWPRWGRAALTWPAYKFCEAHTTLVALTFLALAAIAAPRLWLFLYRTDVLLLAVLAPVLGAGRCAHSIGAHGVEADFARWFQALDPDVDQATELERPHRRARVHS